MRLARVAPVVGFALFFLACVGDTPTTQPDGGATCGSGTKSCGGQCVQLNDPKLGCDSTGCTPCPSDTAKHQAPICDPNQKCAFSSTCDTGYADCDSNAGNGCETPTASDVQNCGACKNTCGTVNTSAVACTTGKCKPTCNAGFAHCTSKDADGCETNVGGSDPKNCGACGHDCLGGTCKAGVCQVVTISSSENKPTAIAVDSGSTGNVYWGNIYFGASANPQQIRVSQKSGGGATKLFDAPNTTQGSLYPYITGVTTAGNFVYWTVSSCDAKPQLVYFGAKNGTGGVQTVKDSNTNLGWINNVAITSDSTNVYWVGSGCSGSEPRNIVKATIGAATGSTLLLDNNNTAPGSLGIAVEDGATGSIFWPNTNSGLRKVSKDGTSNVQLDNQAQTIAINATNVFYSYKSSLFTKGKDGKCGSSGTCPILLATIPSTELITAVVVDDKNVYFNASTLGGSPTGHTYAVKVDGTQSTPVTLGAGLLPAAMAIDDVAVYWVDQFASSVFKVAKLP
jgi:hypothetical protein